MNSTFYSGLQALNVKGVPHEWPPSTYRWCSQWLRAGPGPHGWCLWQQDWCAWHGRSHAVERPGLGDARRGQHAASARALGHLLRSRGVPGNCVIFFFGGVVSVLNSRVLGCCELLGSFSCCEVWREETTPIAIDTPSSARCFCCKIHEKKPNGPRVVRSRVWWSLVVGPTNGWMTYGKSTSPPLLDHLMPLPRWNRP